MTTPRAAALLAAAGGLVVAAGAWMPWVTLYGGLHPLRGTIGPHGKVLLAVGLAAVSFAALVRRRPWSAGLLLLPIAIGVMGFASWLAFVRLPSMMSSLRENPFIVAQPGQGPLVIILGGVLLMLGGVVGMTGRAGEVGGWRGLAPSTSRRPSSTASLPSAG